MQAEKPAWILTRKILPRYGLLIPLLWGRLSIVASQLFQIQDVDDTIIVQVRFGWGGGVVAHPDRQGIELVDNTIAVEIARQQGKGGFRAGVPAGNRGGALSLEEPTGTCRNRIRPGGSGQAEATIRIGCDGGDERLGSV